MAAVTGIGFRLISSGLWHFTQSPLKIIVHKRISQHGVKSVTSLCHFLSPNLSVDLHVLRPGVRFTDKCSLCWYLHFQQ